MRLGGLSTGPVAKDRLARQVRLLSNQAESEYGPRRAAYDLKKLRAKNIVQRIGQTRRYQSSASGLRAMVALVVLRNKAIKPLLAAAQRRRKSRGPQNPRPIDKHYQTIRMAMQGVFDQLGLAALSLSGCFSTTQYVGIGSWMSGLERSVPPRIC